MENTYEKALKLLKSMLNETADFRKGQWEAIQNLVLKKKRVLLVQKTGWGKSIVYFIATRILRDQGRGPTFLISPLLSLMRDQIEIAEKIGINALTINSTNQDDWTQIEASLIQDQCDIILISPERLNNHRFRKNVLPKISGRIGMFVIDEAHCISDWGHDFRPDYMRIVRILKQLSPVVPVLGTTATANDRVIEDIVMQLGQGLVVLRGSLVREGLRLQNIRLGSQAKRLAWLAEYLPKFGDCRGIIYCQTKHDTERVAAWLISKGFNARAYHGGMASDLREEIERSFKANDVDIVVATVALGMGFDKPDVYYVIHFQCPGSVVHYYQQVGRAGRKLEKSYGILLGGLEDEAIQEYFINSAFPSNEVMSGIVNCLEKHETLNFNEILTFVNTSYSILEKAVKLLELEQAIGEDYKERRVFFRTTKQWKPNIERINRITTLRRKEVQEMQEYLDYEGCLMAFLQRTLNDLSPTECKVCAKCTQRGFPSNVPPKLLEEAESYLRGEKIEILPRKRWPNGLFSDEVGRKILISQQNQVGRSLSHYADGIWGELVKKGKYEKGYFSDELVKASASLIKDIWQPDPYPTWITAIPSPRHPTLVLNFANSLAELLNLTFCEVFYCANHSPEQKLMENSLFQSKNVLNSLKTKGKMNAAPVLLVDDIVDSGWTLTLAGYLLLKNGSGPVFPFTLARAAGRKNR